MSLADRAPRGILKPGTLSPKLSVPAHIDRPEYMFHSGPEVVTASDIKTPETVEKIRRAGCIAAQAMEAAAGAIAPGVTTDALGRARPNRPRVHVRPRRLPLLPGLHGFPQVHLHLN